MYTSKNTSVNNRRPAAIYDYIGFDMQGKSVLDYGCGRYFEISKEYAARFKPSSMMFYDPYWKPQNLMYRAFDFIVCANVLNVLQSERDIYQCIENCLNLLEVGGKVYFQIYEGNKFGNGRETKKDCWQRNEKTESYLYYFRNLTDNGYSVMIYKNYIVVKDELPF